FFESLGSGDARGIELRTGDLTVQNGGEITVSGEGTGRAGDLLISSRSIFLNQQGNLTARTISGEGGNIELQVAENLLLRYNSNILTEALGTGNGGNITIDAGGFVVAVLSENSDIAATAIAGRGGSIFVTAKGIFGFSNPGRLVRTLESDLSASSRLGIDGTVTVNAGNYQPDIPLSDRFAPPSLAAGCRTPGQGNHSEMKRSEFYVTGRGGLPPSPSDALQGGSVYVPWGSVTEEESQWSSGDGRGRFEENFPVTEATLLDCYPLF
ncbi:S-layer family protein, partial [Spirulina sp. CS-785/01]